MDVDLDKAVETVDKQEDQSTFSFADIDEQISSVEPESKSKDDSSSQGEKVKTLEGEIQTAEEQAKDLANEFVNILEDLFALKETGFEYTPEVYQDGERRLSPVILKYQIFSMGPLKWLLDFGAVRWVVKLVIKSIVEVRRLRAEREAKEAVENGAVQKHQQAE